MADSSQKIPYYRATTHAITVSVHPSWLEEQSNPDEQSYVWLYRVTIENNATASIQLIARTWILVDAQGQHEEIHGLGVVGEQPVIAPGGHYTYSSGVELKTPSGIMSGQYHMILPKQIPTKREKNSHRHTPLTVNIPPFSLDSPYERIIYH